MPSPRAPEPPRPGPARGSRACTGRLGEQIAATHLEQSGLDVIARNWRIADGDVRGELDVVAVDHNEGQVVFVEVKTRRGPGFGGPLQAVTPSKQARVRRLAVAFLVQAELPYRMVRFDVVGIRLDLDPVEVQHVVAAF